MRIIEKVSNPVDPLPPSQVRPGQLVRGHSDGQLYIGAVGGLFRLSRNTYSSYSSFSGTFDPLPPGTQITLESEV